MDQDRYIEGMLDRTALFYPKEMLERVEIPLLRFPAWGGSAPSPWSFLHGAASGNFGSSTKTVMMHPT